MSTLFGADIILRNSGTDRGYSLRGFVMFVRPVLSQFARRSSRSLSGFFKKFESIGPTP